MERAGAFWGGFGFTLIPWFNAYGAYVTDPTKAAPQMGNPGNPLGLQSPAFNSSFAFFLLFMGTLLDYTLLYIGQDGHQSALISSREILHRPGLSDLPHLFPPYKHRLLHHLPLPRRRLRLPRGCLLESRACV